MCSIYGDAHHEHKNVPFINQHANTHFMGSHDGLKEICMAIFSEATFPSHVHFYSGPHDKHDFITSANPEITLVYMFTLSIKLPS